jgi:hypothetical protein
MFKCGDAKTTPDDAAFKACIAEWIDVNEWLKLIAAESLMPALQSFLGAKRNSISNSRPIRRRPTAAGSRSTRGTTTRL